MQLQVVAGPEASRDLVRRENHGHALLIVRVSVTQRSLQLQRQLERLASPQVSVGERMFLSLSVCLRGRGGGGGGGGGGCFVMDGGNRGRGSGMESNDVFACFLLWWCSVFFWIRL